MQLRQNYRTSDLASTNLGLGDYATGVPAPVVYPRLTVDNPVSETDPDADTRYYVMTYVNELGFESAPGPVNPVPAIVGPNTEVRILSPSISDVVYHPAAYGKEIIQDYWFV